MSSDQLNELVWELLLATTNLVESLSDGWFRPGTDSDSENRVSVTYRCSQTARAWELTDPVHSCSKKPVQCWIKFKVHLGVTVGYCVSDVSGALNLLLVIQSVVTRGTTHTERSRTTAAQLVCQGETLHNLFSVRRGETQSSLWSIVNDRVPLCAVQDHV